MKNKFKRALYLIILLWDAVLVSYLVSMPLPDSLWILRILNDILTTIMAVKIWERMDLGQAKEQ